MRLTTPALASLLCFIIPFADITVAKDNGYAVVYDGGSLPDLKAGKKLTMYIESDQIRIMDGNALVTTLVPSSVQEISYGQDVHRVLVLQSASRLFHSGSVR